MTGPITFGELEVGVVSTMEESRSEPESETPFRILVMGDFSGRCNRGIVEPAGAMSTRRPLLVDRDNFEAVLAKLGVEIHLPLGSGAQNSIGISIEGAVPSVSGGVGRIDRDPIREKSSEEDRCRQKGCRHALETAERGYVGNSR